MLATDALPCDELAAMKMNSSTCTTSDCYPYPNFCPEEERVHLLNIFKDPNFPSAAGNDAASPTAGASATQATLDAENLDPSYIASLAEKYFLNLKDFNNMLQSYPNIKEENVARYLHFFPSKKKACENLDKAILYRSSNSVLSQSDLEVVIKEGFFQYHGKSKDDCCVAYFALDNHDKNKRLAPIETYVKAIIYAVEKEAQRVGKNHVMDTCLIVDRRKATMKNQDIELIKEVLDIITILYPASMPHVLVCPCNLATRMFFNMLKPFIDKKTVECVKLVKDVKEIQQYVHENELKEGMTI